MRLAVHLLIGSLLTLMSIISFHASAQTDFDGLTCSRDSDSITCMVCNIYFEARGESDAGKLAVGQVVMTRVYSNSPLYFDRVCENVYDPSAFSWTQDGKSDRLPTPGHPEYRALLESIDIAEQAYYSGPNGYTNFHADYVRPSWSRKSVCNQKPRKRIGAHIFYDCEGEGDRALRNWNQSSNRPRRPVVVPYPSPRPPDLYSE